MAVRYRDADGAPTDAAAFIDDMTFGASLGRLVRAPVTIAELTIGPPMSAAAATRRALAEDAERFVAAGRSTSPYRPVAGPPCAHAPRSVRDVNCTHAPDVVRRVGRAAIPSIDARRWLHYISIWVNIDR